MKMNDVDWEKDGNNNIIVNDNNVIKIKNLLNETGCGFCLAKFTQVTLHLGTGLVHSCHHPKSHIIPLEELDNNPAALFNTSHLKKARSEMQNGIKPSECDYCWRVEDSNGFSDRFYKSLESWALPNHDTIVNFDPNENIYPTYLEVDFSNVCNFKCIYCGPEFSTQWADELRRKGPIKLLEKTKNEYWVQGWQTDLETMTYKNREFNPYIDAFWKWFPEAYKHLKTYRITGGEPLLSKETFRSIQWFIDNPNPNMEFAINSNLGAPDKLWEEFKEKVKKLIESNSVYKFTIFTSVDAWGNKAEYLRPGLNFNLWKKRFEELLQIGNVRVVTMCTFNILSVTSIKELLQWHAELKRKYNPDHGNRQIEIETGYHNLQDRSLKNMTHPAIVGIDTPYLRYPQMLDAQYITPNLIEKYLLPALNYMASNVSYPTWMAHQGFETFELDKFKRVCADLMRRRKNNNNVDNETNLNRAKFYSYINEIDNRNTTNFIEVFPEMSDFYNICKKEHDNLIDIKTI